jgi:acetyl-CoA carboxylase biotin carboxyl carrier protein
MELKELYALMDRFEKSGLSELTYKKGVDEICLKKAVAALPPVQAIPVPSPQAAHAQSTAVDPKQAPGTELICSPLVGTFYRSAAPDAPPFVEKGDTVKKGGPLCILEAMKLMNEYQAEFDMEIVSILVDNGKMVEFGAPLFEVRRI